MRKSDLFFILDITSRIRVERINTFTSYRLPAMTDDDRQKYFKLMKSIGPFGLESAMNVWHPTAYHIDFKKIMDIIFSYLTEEEKVFWKLKYA